MPLAVPAPPDSLRSRPDAVDGTTSDHRPRWSRGRACGLPRAAGRGWIGYSIAPDFRRQGYARSTLIELLRRAAAEPAVTTVRAAISPDNVASLATIAGLGFVEVGEQWDEEDGREVVLEVPARQVPSA
ncbi:GNAT family N-acetyltransferase [Streptomyces tendae]|uniref:GNAT family N-acetyltransferase n=1 Tax=Streptomyces tendae TaxID=1932 RepID=UPI003655EC30